MLPRESHGFKERPESDQHVVLPRSSLLLSVFASLLLSAFVINEARNRVRSKL